MDLCKYPAGVSPDGVYNFDDPPSLGPAVVGVSVALGTISTIFTFGRLWINRKKLHIADYFTLVGWLINVAYTGVICAQYKYYRNSWNTPVCWYTGDYLKLPFVQTMLFAGAFFFPKAAIFLLYRQVFGVKKWLRVAVDIGLAVTLLTYLSEIPMAVIYAAPRPGQSWDDLLLSLEANSHHFALGGTIQSIICTVTDFYLFFLPMPILYTLQMRPAQRWQLVGVFSLALLGVGASIASLYFKMLVVLSATDSNWAAGETSMCSLIESNIAIVVGCAPAFAQRVTARLNGSAFFRSLRSRLLGGSGGTSGAVSGKEQSGGGSVPKLVTFGSNQTPRNKNNYYELTDSVLLKTQATIPDAASETDAPSKPASAHSGTEHWVNAKGGSFA